jgi:phenylpropionate dioxygenase-like ring-hydroxylating dioxygenase large terminal subunit
MLLKNCWYVAAFADEVGEQPLARTIAGEPIVMFRTAGGALAALEDRCCHRGLPLAFGAVIGETLRCGYHGLQFDTGGHCVKVPGQDVIPPAARVRSFPVAERDGLVWLWPGDAAAADAAKIVRYRWHAEPGWAYKGKRNAVAADWLLIIDNLLDLTHVGYVHASTIGGTPDAHSNAEMRTERTDDGVSFVRWLRNSVPPPTYVAAAGFTGRVDRWSVIEWTPGILTIDAGAMDVGRGAYEGNREGAFSLLSLHAVTPETDSSAHYFWTVAHRVRADMPELTDRVYREIDTAFAEDKVVIEAQFARLRERPLPPLVAIKSDGAGVHARRVIARRMAAEQSQREPALSR